VHSLSRFPFPIFVLFNRGRKKKSILLEREVQLSETVFFPLKNDSVVSLWHLPFNVITARILKLDAVSKAVSVV